ncbi:MAG: DUF4062 domain-containing protein [Proteobacteria bacterium]|nr:DUF4062 domain-containing protein [Pseudomonadota bacterium]
MPFAPFEEQKPANAGPPVTVDALKRRYQVFVSSTYEDLKEERQHVIQALLETKCIPLGMELFPAASVEQWQLIKRVIDECDYYLVVVAGRYGSLSETGIGFTEMEFDYAMRIGKPVIGFYHKSPDTLPGSKLEKTDAGRERLRKFAERVRSKLCRPWASAAELGSAVKSAILSELEFNPKPGWIRADAVPSSDAVEKLKQKVADLEEKLKKQKDSGRLQFAGGAEKLRVVVVVSHDFRKMRSGLSFPQKSFERAIEMTWDSIILIWRDDLERGVNLSRLTESLREHLRGSVQSIICEVLGGSDVEHDYDIEHECMDRILQTFLARRLVKRIGSYSGASGWTFTPKGMHYVAELQAIRSST